MTRIIKKVHDKFIRDLMSRKEAVRDFLRFHLSPEMVDMLDLSTLEIKKDTFVDHELAEHFSDILYEIKLRNGQDVKIYVLIEHKSYSDYLVAFQLLRYMVKIWELELKQQQAERKKKKKEEKEREKKETKETKETKKKEKSQPQEKLTLTPILPIVFYHGSQEWKVPLNFHEIFNHLPSLLAPYVPNYRYFLYDLTKVDDSEIQGNLYLRIGLLSLKYALHKDLPEKVDEIFSLFDHFTDHQAAREYLETLVRYLSNRLPPEHIKTALKKKFSEEGETLMTTFAETFIKQGLEQGRKEGRAEMEQEVQKAHQEVVQEVLASIKFGLDLKFGEEGLRLFNNEVQQIQETSLLKAIRAALKFVSDLGELRSIYQPTPATN